MERIGRGSLIRAGVTALIALTFMVCSNPIDIVDKVTIDVKAANNKFLVIKSVGPSTNTTNVNPGAPITIVFDRDVNLTNIHQNITITPSTPFMIPLSYNQATKTLSIEADPYFDIETPYTVTITKGIKGSDGSDLQNEYSWSFRTGTYPTGSVQITDAAKNKLLLTNNDASPTLRIQGNLAASKFRLGRTESECLGAAWQNLPLTDWLVLNASTLLSPFTLGGADGPQTVYSQFARESDGAMSTVKSDTVSMDKTPPTVDAGQDRWVNAVNTTTPYLVAASDLNGIKSYSWSAAAPVVISPTNILSPTLSAPGGSDGPTAVMLTVVDNAGNSASDTMTLTRDATAPNGAPSITPPTTPAATAFPVWSWAKTSSAGGETTPIYRVLMDGAIVKDKSISTTYIPPNKPPKATGLADGNHTFTVYETDNAGNLSPVSSFPFTVTVFPMNESTLTTFTPTFRWHTMWDRNGWPAEYYVLHIGSAFKGGEMKMLYTSVSLPPSESKDEVQTFLLPAGYLNKTLDSTIYWYVDMPKQGLRTPADPNAAWSFVNFKG